MIELRTLGTLELTSAEGRVLRSVLAQPRRTALLCYLALASPRGFHSRETLFPLFWPEHDAEQARHALRQALYFLRRGLGPKAIVSQGDAMVALAPDQVRCDASEFERAVSEGRLDAALALYRGDLLVGFHVSEAPDFERWLDDARDRLRRRAGEAAWALAELRARNGEAAGAAESARRAAAFFPADETVLRRLVLFLDRLGDRAAAVRAYEAFAWNLEQEYELEPSAETRALAESIRVAPNLRLGSRLAEPSSTGPRLRTANLPGGLEPLPASAGEPNVTEPAGRASRRRQWALTASALVLAATALAAGLWRLGPFARPSVELPDSVVAVVPFRVTAADSSLGYLGEGMVDLLAVRLTGEGGPRAVDPRAALAGWRRLTSDSNGERRRDAVFQVAGAVGAGQVIDGGIIGGPSRFVITATMRRAPTGDVRARGSVQGPVDSLGTLVDRLAGQLLLGAGERYEAGITFTSLPALRAYLDGQRAYRAGQYDEAVTQFRRALEADSTFIPAALGLTWAFGWAEEVHYPNRAVPLAWAARDRLSPRDRALLEAQVGRVPDPSGAELLAARERAVAQAPDRADSWYLLGDGYLHLGAVLELHDATGRATAALRRALELDSTFAGPLLHLVELAGAKDDTAGVRRLSAILLRTKTAGEVAEYVRWRRALALHDTAALAAVRTRLDTAPDLRLHWRIVHATQYDGLPPPDARRAFRALDQGVITRDDRNRLGGLKHSFALNAGRPAEALEVTGTWTGVSMWGHRHLWARVLDALFWGGDTAAARNAAAELAAAVRLPLAGADSAAAQRHWDICVLEVWRLAAGEISTADQAVRKLRRAAPLAGAEYVVEVARLCANVLETWLATLRADPRRTILLASLDSLMRTGPPSWPIGHFGFENLLVARLYEGIGDPRRALAAVRRRSVYGGLKPMYLSSYLSEEGRLAALLGDREGAIRSYRHYLALRPDPEPARRPVVEQVRAELARLEGRR